MSADPNESKSDIHKKNQLAFDAIVIDPELANDVGGAVASANQHDAQPPAPDQPPTSEHLPENESLPTVESLWVVLRKKHPNALPLHPLCELFPPLAPEQFWKLVEDIKQNGLRQPIYIVDGKIFDGANRYFACLEAGVGPIFTVWDPTRDLVADIISLNLRRRNLNESQRAMVAAKLVPFLQVNLAKNVPAESQPKAETNATPAPVRAKLRGTKNKATKKAAKVLNVSERSVETALPSVPR